MDRTEHLENEVKRLKSAVDELMVLNDLAITASSSLEVNQMLDTIVQKSLKAVKAEQGSIQLVTEMKENPLQTLIRQNDFSGAAKSYRLGSHITGWVLKNHQPLLIENLGTDKRFNSTEQERREIHSALCVPIWLKAKIIGILMVTNKKTGEPFNSDDLRLLSIISAQSGQLIHNSKLQEEALEKTRLQQELNMAQQIQMSLLPVEDPRFPGLEIASYFKPADEVGGDYFDYIKLGDDKIGIVVADVSGHGPSAALMMTMIKGVFHSIILDFESSGMAMEKVNKIASKILPDDMFVTMLFLVIDQKNKILYYTNAGHNPFVFYSKKDDACRMVESPSCAINLSYTSPFSVDEIQLNDGDLFFVYTDGVTEAINKKQEMFNTTNLSNAIAEKTSETALKIVDNVKEKLYTFIEDSKPEDDIAMIAVKIKAQQ